MDTKSVLITGVGGQGILLASKVLASILVANGFDVKVSEVHGMAQRGGDVHCMLRYGSDVASPLIGTGEADILLGLEELEALRWLGHLRGDGHVFVNMQRILTVGMARGEVIYPDAFSIIQECTKNSISIDGQRLAKAAGSPKAVNIVLLGAAANLFDFSVKEWEEHLQNSIPARFVEANLKAFELGLEAGHRSSWLRGG